MAEIWAAAIGAAAAVGGLAMAYKGQKDQKKANDAANATNTANQDNQNKVAWSNYLMSRGLAPTTAITPGQLPMPGQAVAVNTRMPLWMSINRSDIARGQGLTLPATGDGSGSGPDTRKVIGWRVPQAMPTAPTANAGLN